MAQTGPSGRFTTVWLIAASCSPAAPATRPAPAMQEDPPSAPSATSPTPSAQVSLPAPQPDAAPVKSEVLQACESMCERVAELCGEVKARTCAARCPKYEDEAKGCDHEMANALACQQRSPKGELCSAVAALSCTESFGALRSCQRGEVGTKTAQHIPANWARVEVASLHLSLMMPPGPERSTAPEGLRAREGDAEFVVQALRPLPSATEAGLTRAVIEFSGIACQAKLRLHGRYDADGRTAVRFETGCADGSRWHGMLHHTAGQTLAIGVHHKGQLDAKMIDAFLFGCELR